MTWCEPQIVTFNDKIKLDSGRLERIRGAVQRLDEFCEKDDQLRAARDGGVFLQGSVSTKTVIKPLADDEFDVDVVYPFKLDAFREGVTPSQIIQWFLDRLRQSDFYKNALIPRDRCARLDYAGDFHLDVIPATKSVAAHQPYAVPAKDLGSWITSDPAGFANWVAGRDSRSEAVDSDGVGRFVRSCRMMKRWRDEKLDAENAPTSILLVTMLGKHDPTSTGYNPPLEKPLYPQYKTDVAYLYDMLRLTHSCLRSSRRTAFLHPTILDEDLSQGWDAKNLEYFLERLQMCINWIYAGIYAGNEGDSIGHYRNAFGDTFPAS
jgi:hypothetical protein